MVIHKYTLANKPTLDRLLMPEGAKILHLGLQRHALRIWALVNPDSQKVYRTFKIVTTGQNFDPAGHEYIGTFQAEGGNFVGHVFEKIVSL